MISAWANEGRPVGTGLEGRSAGRGHRGSTVLIALGVIVAAACVQPQPLTDRGYSLVYQENFDGTAIPPVWQPAANGGSLAPTVANGVMTVRTTAANDYRWGYVGTTGPRLETEPNYPFMTAWEEGYFEARLRYTNNEWAWPAFWLYSAATTEARPGENCRYLTAEWDIMENGINHPYSGTDPAVHGYVGVIHRNTTDGTADGYCGVADERRVILRSMDDVDLSQWHIWAGRWEGQRLCHYLDNVEIACMDAYDSTAQPMHMVVTMQYLKECPGCGPRPSAMQMQVDWVRVYQR